MIEARVKGRLPLRLAQCWGCGFHVMPKATLCPHCGSDVKKMKARHDRALAKAQKAMAALRAILTRARSAKS